MKTKTPKPDSAHSEARPFKVRVYEALRYILWYHQDDEEFEAECIDAGATGLGVTQQDALQDLIINLNALHQFTVEDGGNMFTQAAEDDERTYARLAAGQPVDPSALGFGVVHRVEVTPTAKGRKREAPSISGFEISRHTSLAA